MQCGVSLGARQGGQAPHLGMEAGEVPALAHKQALEVRHQAVVGGLDRQRGIVGAAEPAVEAGEAGPGAVGGSLPGLVLGPQRGHQVGLALALRIIGQVAGIQRLQGQAGAQRQGAEVGQALARERVVIAAADTEASRQRQAGLEVLVYGVPAYSTLGWTNWLGGDPLLNTFVNGSEAGLARLIFHELAHQVAYASGDTMFNESYATAVERLGLARWLALTGRADDELQARQRRDDIRALTHAARAQLLTLFASDLPDAQKRLRKAEVMAALRADYQAMKAAPGGAWAGFDGYDSWFERANNAALALQAAYDGLVPDFERLFDRQGRDFAKLHAAVHHLAGLSQAERRATLQASP